MQKPIYILFICLMAAPILAQNFMLTYAGGRFHEIVPLQTDSMYIVSGTQTREAAFEFDANHRLRISRYRLVDSNQNYEFREIIATTYSPNKVISIDSFTIILPSPNISLSRTTTDSLDGKVVSFIGETSYNNVWKETQKDTFLYDASNRLIERSSQFWDFVNMAWKYTSFQRLEYDAQDHISVRRELGVGNSIIDTTYYGEYLYTYNTDGKITSLISRYGSPPKNNARETYVYDNNENLDSLKIDYWNFGLQIWQPGYFYTLDDSPEQQASTNGRIYRLNSQSQWYLDSEASYTPGPHIYTDEPAEVLKKKFNTNTNQLENDERQRTTYIELPGGTIKGDIQRDDYSNGNWQSLLQVEAWFRKIENVDTKTPDQSKVSNCGLPNPLAFVDLQGSVPEITAVEQIDLFSMGGSLVLSQSTDQKVSLENAPNKQPALYWLVLRDKTNIICAQKLVLY